MSKKDNGGLAFPVSVTMPDGSVAVERGMSLRDYFAAKAMQGLISAKAGLVGNDYDLARLTETSFRVSDAMLAERAK